jgi:hypothetical protein
MPLSISLEKGMHGRTTALTFTLSVPGIEEKPHMSDSLRLHVPSNHRDLNTPTIRGLCLL